MRQAILDCLQACVHPDDRLLVIHSSLPHLKPPAQVGKWDFLWALRQLLAGGHSIAIPAFTFSFCRGKPFDLKASPSETGLLGDWALDLPEFRRTRHPIYSYAVAGPLADQVLACRNSTTFGADSQLALFEALDARILMMGCDWSYCTQFHRYEEEAAVPYRYFKTFGAQADFGEGMAEAKATMLVRTLDVPCRNDFEPVIRLMHQARAVVSRPLWGGVVESAACSAVAAACRQVLADPWGMVEQGHRSAWLLERKQMAAGQAPVRLALMGSANLQLVADQTGRILGEALPDRRLELFQPAFGQAIRQMLDAGSDLYRAPPDMAVFLDRLEDLLGVMDLDGVDWTQAEARFEQYMEALSAYRGRVGGWMMVSLFPLSGSGLTGAAGTSAEGGVRDRLEAMNRRLLSLTRSLPQIVVFDPAGLGGDSMAAMTDDRLWLMGRFPYSDPFSAKVAHRIARFSIAALGRSVRLLAIDLDNTLWGGVLGEDGMDGLQLGGDFPGNAFGQFQRQLKVLADHGVALAVLSKNDEAQALDVIDRHPGMVLRRADLAAHAIDWREKPENLKAICQDLQLGVDHVLFIDDNPVERAKMARELPGVKILDLPQDPAGYAEALRNCLWLDFLSVTDEDRKRTAAYQAQGRVRAARSAAGDLESFYASLESRLTLAPVTAGTMVRTVQLLSKTNQFNATTRRHAQADLQSFLAAGHSVLTIGLQDRFSAPEIVGVLIVRWNEPRPGVAMIDSYLLSCRVLGRGFEPMLPRWLAGEAKRRGCTLLLGEIVDTERNTPVRAVYAEAGFQPGDRPGQWVLDLSGQLPTLPSWLTVTFADAPGEYA